MFSTLYPIPPLVYLVNVELEEDENGLEETHTDQGSIAQNEGSLLITGSNKPVHHDNGNKMYNYDKDYVSN